MIKGIKIFTAETDSKILKRIEEYWCGIYRIRPAVAESILENYHPHNRPVKKANLRQLATTMGNDDFVINGESLIFQINPDGQVSLTDGQHRLRAAIESGASFDTYVTFSPQTRVMGTIDTGTKRTAADSLIIDGNISKSPTLYATVAKFICLEKIGRHAFERQTIVTNNQIVELVREEKNRFIIDAVIDHSKQGQYLVDLGIPPAVTVFFGFKAFHNGISNIERFLILFGTGMTDEGLLLKKNHIISKYRSKIPNVRENPQKYSTAPKNAKIKGNQYKTIQYNILASCFNDWITKADRSKPTTTRFDPDKCVPIFKSVRIPRKK